MLEKYGKYAKTVIRFNGINYVGGKFFQKGIYKNEKPNKRKP